MYKIHFDIYTRNKINQNIFVYTMIEKKWVNVIVILVRNYYPRITMQIHGIKIIFPKRITMQIIDFVENLF